MYQIGDGFRFKSKNGITYKIVIVNKNEFRPPDEKYAADVWGKNGAYVGDVMFFGDDFLNKCEKVDK